MLRVDQCAGVLLAGALLLVSGPVGAETLTAAQAVERAVGGNQELQAVLLDLRAAFEAVRAAESSHEPTFTAEAGGGHAESLSATADGIATGGADSFEASAGVHYGAPWGTDLSVELGAGWYNRDVNRDPSAPMSLDLGSTYGGEARVSVTQPLLRGAGRDVGEATIRAARSSRSAAEHARDDAASQLVRDVVLGYWELWYAQAAVQVQQSARDLAQRQLDEVEARVAQLGTVARVEALRYATELATIEEALVAAEATRRSRATELGRLLGMEPAEAAGLVASEAPPPAPAEAPTMAALVEEVRASSAELLQLQAEVDATRDEVRVAADGALPRLDLEGSFGVVGLWNDESISSLALPGDRPALSGRVGLALELPIGNGQARAELARARHRASAAEARLEARSRAIEAEAVSRLEELETAGQRLGLATRSAELARQLAEAEQERQRLGTATTTEVLDAQESARQTELRRLRALVDRVEASLSAEHLAGSLLARYATAEGEIGERP